MERLIPKNSNATILRGLIGFDNKSLTPDFIDVKIKELENKCEKSIIKTFSKLNIQSSTKTDRYSLPYKDEVIVTLNGESYLNGPYEFHRVTREIVKDVLNRNAYKIRFYIFIEIDEKPLFGRVIYHFRYYIH